MHNTIDFFPNGAVDPSPLMQTNPSHPQTDCIVVGASFAGLACASALARTGMRVTVLEKKADPGEKLHTTGIIVKDAIDHVPLLDGLPRELVHRINGVRLYASNLRYVDLAAPGYYFLATETPNVMRWLAAQAEREKARVEINAKSAEAQIASQENRLQQLRATYELRKSQIDQLQVRAGAAGVGQGADLRR